MGIAYKKILRSYASDSPIESVPPLQWTTSAIVHIDPTTYFLSFLSWKSPMLSEGEILKERPSRYRFRQLKGYTTLL